MSGWRIVKDKEGKITDGEIVAARVFFDTMMGYSKDIPISSLPASNRLGMMAAIKGGNIFLNHLIEELDKTIK